MRYKSSTRKEAGGPLGGKFPIVFPKRVKGPRWGSHNGVRSKKSYAQKGGVEG